MFERFSPLIAEWFRDTYGEPTEIQRLAWPAIADGEHVLITAPTGSGKTLTAFLSAIDRLARGQWELGTTRVLYISPLKALNNDIRRNLREPLEQLAERSRRSGARWPEISVAVRSGDTPGSERQRMIRRPPEILITTPESLNLILSSPRASAMLSGVRTVILDEIHAIVGGKRGTHLITAVERMVRTAGEFQRIAVSATVRPLERVAAFVGGYRLLTPDGAGADDAYEPRPVRTIAATATKKLSVTVDYPVRPSEQRLAESDPGIWGDLTAAFLTIIESNRSTLFFVTTRRHAEKITLLLNEDRDEPIAYSHHGSLSRELRLFVEQELKAGRLKAIVATNSLELGIDVGELDEVVLVKAPQSVASAVQRIGRAGHRVGVTSRGRIIPLAGRDFLDAAVIARAVLDADIEETAPVRGALDLLAQIIVSMLSGGPRRLDELYAELRSSYSYHELDRRQFDLVMEMLAGRYADTQIRELRPRVAIDRTDDTAHLREGTLRLLYQSGGTIPDRGQYTMRMSGTGAKLGELDEEFVWERRVGEQFVFGTRVWTVTEITDRDVVVLPAAPQNKLIPFWRADRQHRAFHYSERILTFLQSAEEALARGSDGVRQLTARLQADHSMSADAAVALVEFLVDQRETTGAALPHRRHILLEHSIDPKARRDAQELIVHTGWGGTVNQPFALALSAAWEEVNGYPVEIFADDDCLLIHVPHEVDAAALFAPRFLQELRSNQKLTGLLRRRLENAELFGALFRENAGRALLLPRPGFGKRMPLWLNRLRAKKLLGAVHRFDDFPILLETWRFCLQDLFDLPTLADLVEEIIIGRISVTECETHTPSPLARTMVWQQTNRYMYQTDELATPRSSNLSDELMAEVLRSAELRPRIPADQADEFELRLQRRSAQYAPGSAQELLDWTSERIIIPKDEFDQLRSLAPALEELPADIADRLVTLTTSGGSQLVTTAAGSAAYHSFTDAPTAFLAEWLRFYTPKSVEWIAQTLGVDATIVRQTVDELVAAGTLIAGTLRADTDEQLVCDANNLEMLLRRRRRSQSGAVEPQPLELLVPLVAERTGVVGDIDTERPASTPDSLPEVIDRLVGYPAPAACWEAELLSVRFGDYFPVWLDGLFAGEELIWLGTGNTRITLCLREDLPLVQEAPATIDTPTRLDPGASYTFWELVDLWGLESGELTELLWRLAWEGRLTTNRFETLRRGIASGFAAEPATRATPVAPAVAASSRRRRAGRTGYARWKSSRPTDGRWTVLPQPESDLSPIETRELEKERARIVLDRYGIVFKELLERECPALQWRRVYRALRLMELSGEVVSGPFVHGPTGLQFALPHAADLLQHAAEDDRVRIINAVDPASLSGLGLAGLAQIMPPRVPSNHLVYHGARLVLVSRRNGADLTVAVPADSAELPSYFSRLKHLVGRRSGALRRVLVETINEVAVRDSPYANALEAAGFRRGYQGFSLQAGHH